MLKPKLIARRDSRVRDARNWIGTAELTIRYLHQGLGSPSWFGAVVGLAGPLLMLVEFGCGREQRQTADKPQTLVDG